MLESFGNWKGRLRDQVMSGTMRGRRRGAVHREDPGI